MIQIERVDVEPFERFPDPHIRLKVLVKVGSLHILIYPRLGVAIGDGVKRLGEALGHYYVPVRYVHTHSGSGRRRSLKSVFIPRPNSSLPFARAA